MYNVHIIEVLLFRHGYLIPANISVDKNFSLPMLSGSAEIGLKLRSISLSLLSFAMSPGNSLKPLAPMDR